MVSIPLDELERVTGAADAGVSTPMWQTATAKNVMSAQPGPPAATNTSWSGGGGSSDKSLLFDPAYIREQMCL